MIGLPSECLLPRRRADPSRRPKPAQSSCQILKLPDVLRIGIDPVWGNASMQIRHSRSPAVATTNLFSYLTNCDDRLTPHNITKIGGSHTGRKRHKSFFVSLYAVRALLAF